MYCIYCGNQMDDNDAYCNSCGARNEQQATNGGFFQSAEDINNMSGGNSFNNNTYNNSYNNGYNNMSPTGYANSMGNMGYNGSYGNLIFRSAKSKRVIGCIISIILDIILIIFLFKNLGRAAFASLFSSEAQIFTAFMVLFIILLFIEMICEIVRLTVCVKMNICIYENRIMGIGAKKSGLSKIIFDLGYSDIMRVEKKFGVLVLHTRIGQIAFFGTENLDFVFNEINMRIIRY